MMARGFFSDPHTEVIPTLRSKEAWRVLGNTALSLFIYI
jgi:hypothetical protein